MTVQDYIKYAIKNDYPKYYKWLVDMFSIVAEDYEDEFVKVNNNNFYVKIKDNEQTEEVLLISDYKEPVVNPKTKIKVEKGFLPNIKEDIETTVGRLLVNYLLLSRNFGDKIPYINQKFTVSYIEDTYIAPMLIGKKEEEQGKKGITISEYTKFVDSVTYLMRINRFLVPSSTEKNVTQPEDVVEYRQKLIEECKKKYGDNCMEKMDKVAEIESKLKQWLKEKLKDDPIVDKLGHGKTLDAMRKMYTMYGHGGDFFYQDGKAHVIEKSLEEGWDKDDETITILYNDIRMASYKRGAETQKGGYTAKQALRATNDIKIIDTDCGSKVTYSFKVKKDNYSKIIGRYMLVNGKLKLIETKDDAKALIGKTVELRSPLYCKLEHHFCKICCGEKMKNYENGIAMMVVNAAGIILNTSMKAMHNQSLELTRLDLEDLD